MTIFPQEHFVNLHLFRQNFQPAWHIPLVPSLTRFRDCNMTPSWWPLVWHLWLQQAQGYQEGIVKIGSTMLHRSVWSTWPLWTLGLRWCNALQCNAIKCQNQTRIGPVLWSIWSFPSSDAVWHFHNEWLKNISSVQQTTLASYGWYIITCKISWCTSTSPEWDRKHVFIMTQFWRSMAFLPGATAEQFDIVLLHAKLIPCEIWMQFKKYNFQSCFTIWYLQIFLW